MVLLIVFFIQNQDMITVKFLGWEGRLAQGVAFFIAAAVGGGILVDLTREIGVLLEQLLLGGVGGAPDLRQRSLGPTPRAKRARWPHRPPDANRFDASLAFFTWWGQ
ncbi:hypothetical protein ABH924_004436 [Arthrobacter sp. GAS37]|uniref:hypothetical protein n=1 Tax=Arthrobacter sp. GAS37 TaxID=3156261 RepID=UPI00383484EB